MVNDLPTEMEALHTHIWNAINADNMETATRLLRLWEASFHSLVALTIWVAEENEIPRQADGTVSDTTVEHITRCVQSTLDMHTRGILQVSPTGVANILHRSAADWHEKSSIWNDICSKTPKDFDSNLTLLEVGVVRLGDKVRVRLGRGRTLRSDFWGTVTDYLWRGFFVRDTSRNQKKLVEMLDEFDKVATRVVNEIDLLRNTWESKEWVPTDFNRLVGGPHYSPYHWAVTQGSTGVREGVVSENCFIGLAAQMGMLPYVKARVSQNPDLAMSSSTRISLLANATFGFHYHSLRRAVSRYVIQVPTFRQRLRTVKYLLHHGADPCGPIWPEDPKFTVSDQVLLLADPSDKEEEKEKVEKEKSKEEELIRGGIEEGKS